MLSRPCSCLRTILCLLYPGLKTYVVEDATRPVSVSGGEAAIADMITRGVLFYHLIHLHVQTCINIHTH